MLVGFVMAVLLASFEINVVDTSDMCMKREFAKMSIMRVVDAVMVKGKGHH